VLTQRAAELYRALATSAQGAEAATATKNADKLTADAGRYEKDVGNLQAALAGGISSSAAVGGSSSGKIPQKSQAEILKIIASVGSSDPDWLASTTLNYPPTLDLTWTPPVKGTPWNQNKILGQFIWSTVNENPGQWKNGVKVMYKVMDVNKADQPKLVQTYNALARMYFNYFKDYPRAAYWWTKAGNTDNIDLAHCYYQMGNLDMAKKILQGYPFDTTGNGDVIIAWGIFGDIDKALKMAESRMQTNSPDVGYLLAGDVCRMAGRYDEALKYYDGFLKLKGNLPQKHKDRAQDGYNTIKYFNMFDLSKVPDGVYKDSGVGYRGPVESVVTVAGHKITDIKINHREDQFYSSITDIPARIIEKQTIKGIDACSGATMTSNAIVVGTAKALGNAVKP
ncbi:MAG TPA: FMN-binding protein, partial [Planctomycetota bacterium]|nr:FMN-binding protein [Planctomycetota bacterium]